VREEVAGEAKEAVGRAREPDVGGGGSARQEPKFAAVGLEDGLTRSVGRRRASRVRAEVERAAEAYQRGRHQETLKTLAPIAKEHPGLIEVRELKGLAAYRSGKWKLAIAELEALETLVGTREQHHVLADCHRALGNWRRVEDLWAELGDDTESDEVVNEARIVTASARADKGDPVSGIALIEPALERRSKKSEAGKRLRYVLADLYERSGDLPRARREFAGLAATGGGYADVLERLEALE